MFFKNSKLLIQSLIHPSLYLENEKKIHLNEFERFEFLGDRVLGLVISKNLLSKYPNENEGTIDKKYANLVNKKKCAEIASIIDLKKFMLFVLILNSVS